MLLLDEDDAILLPSRFISFCNRLMRRVFRYVDDTADDTATIGPRLPAAIFLIAIPRMRARLTLAAARHGQAVHVKFFFAHAASQIAKPRSLRYIARRQYFAALLLHAR